MITPNVSNSDALFLKLDIFPVIKKVNYKKLIDFECLDLRFIEIQLIAGIKNFMLILNHEFFVKYWLFINLTFF